MDATSRTHRTDKKQLQLFDRKGRNHLEDLDIIGRVILKRFLRKNCEGA
jgi:hypothetical protein